MAYELVSGYHFGSTMKMHFNVPKLVDFFFFNHSPSVVSRGLMNESLLGIENGKRGGILKIRDKGEG